MTLLDEDWQWPASSTNKLAPVVAVVNNKWSMRAAKLPRAYLFVTGFLGGARRLYFFDPSIISLFSGTNSSSSSGFSGILSTTPSILVVVSLFSFKVSSIEGPSCA